MRRRHAIAVLFLALAAAVVVFWPRKTPDPAVSRESEALPVVQYSGPTMGTRYAVTVVCEPAAFDRAAVADDIEAALRRVDELMSTYRDDSELSRFNASRETAWQPVSLETAQVAHTALQIGRATGGAYDVTCKPLVELWSFGAKAESPRVPGEAEIAEARQHVGLDKVAVRLDPPTLRKLDPAVTLDLSSLAPGYAGDLIAAALDRRGLTRYLIDVSGEMKARGLNGVGQPWQVGIDRPQSGPHAIYCVLELRDGALATSGDYRNFFDRDGRHYSHILDVRTGRSIEHGLASVTVLEPSCMRADAWATALLALGPDEGLRLAERQNLAALFLIRHGDQLEERRTPALHPK